MKKQKFIILLVSLIFLFIGCSSGEAGNKKEIQNTDNAEKDIMKEMMDDERKNLLAIKQEKYELMLKREKESKKMYISRDNVSLYKDMKLSEAVKKLNKKDVVYKIDLDNNSDEDIIKVRESNISDEVYYIKGKYLNASIKDFIIRPFEGVDYDHVIEDPNYENNPKVKAKGIYLTINTFTNLERLEELIQKTKETEINAFVVDVKNDSDHLLFPSEAAKTYNPKAYRESGEEKVKKAIKMAKDNNIYLIARVVAFKSPQYALANPTHSITYKGTNTVYKNRNGVAWASAYDRDLWDYNIAVSKEAADYGFNEIQFDYVRFPALSSRTRAKLDFKNKKNETKPAAIHKFLKKAYKEISEKEVYVSADIFGWSASSISDEGIGQHWEALITAIDYSCPMIYPSHYGKGNFGYSVPDAHPYGTVYKATQDAIDRNGNVENPALLRPWLQDFSAPWVTGYINYGPEEVGKQIKALKDLEVEEYILWSPGNNYSWEALKK